MVLPILAVKDLASVLFAGINNKTKQKLYETGFYFGGGIFAGILLNDLFRLLNIPPHPVVVSTPYGTETSGMRIDELWQNGIATAILIAGILLQKSDLMALASGAYFGISIANKSERHQYIGAT